ncbi:MAG: HNH endonuclease [Nostocales cyanobacterium]|nr:MAG: HNH endonuclease [Nostocales cyanobacterium]TAF16109.1 MAG: HNH endonuclease [Nostocales cyanobacterium]
MNKITKLQLQILYTASEIAELWNYSQNLAVINHPQHGLISPNDYRTMKKGKPCPYCGQKMTHGQEYKTKSKLEARKRGYEYINDKSEKTINQAGLIYFHPNYVTLDHKINKARCPEKMFDYENLQAICWRCNVSKGDDNTYEIRHTFNYLECLANEAIDRYKLL